MLYSDDNIFATTKCTHKFYPSVPRKSRLRTYLSKIFGIRKSETNTSSEKFYSRFIPKSSQNLCKKCQREEKILQKEFEKCIKGNKKSADRIRQREQKREKNLQDEMRITRKGFEDKYQEWGEEKWGR